VSALMVSIIQPFLARASVIENTGRCSILTCCAISQTRNPASGGWTIRQVHWASVICRTYSRRRAVWVSRSGCWKAVNEGEIDAAFMSTATCLSSAAIRTAIRSSTSAHWWSMRLAAKPLSSSFSAFVITAVPILSLWPEGY